MSIASPSALITAAEFDPRDHDVPVELIRGEIVEMHRSGGVQGAVPATLVRRLDEWAKSLDEWMDSTGSGVVDSHDSGVVTEQRPDAVRGPHLSDIRDERLPEGRLPAGSLAVPPVLEMGVLSPHDHWRKANTKVYEYLLSGEGVVWSADPASRTVRVLPADGLPTTSHDSNALSSPGALPGFRGPVRPWGLRR